MNINLVTMFDGPTGWYWDLMVKEGRKTIGKLKIAGSDLTDDETHPVIHYWHFATREEKEEGGKARETYIARVSEIAGSVGIFTGLVDDRIKKTFLFTKGKLVIRGNDFIVAVTGQLYAYKATLDGIARSQRDDDNDPWVRVKLKRPA